ncbi:MAG: site-specific integrase, partial [Clostridia bacterium]|nr:site-specific integrase [Clostridia bacterium]
MRQEEIVTLPNLVRLYLNYLSGVKSKSELTVLEYASDLRMFFRFIARSRGLCEKSVPFDEINISLMDDNTICSVSLDEAYLFLAYCRNERKNDNNSRARKVTAIKRFYKYLEVNGRISVNRINLLESPQKKKSLPKYLTLEQSLDILNNVDGKNKAANSNAYFTISFLLFKNIDMKDLYHLIIQKA